VRAVTFLDFYRSSDGRRVLACQALALAAVAIALTLGLGDGRLDLTVARWFFDDARRVFPLTNQWLLKSLLHDVARTTSAVAALALLGVTLASWATPRLRAVRAHREALLFTSIATFAAVALVGGLKHYSAHACPWNLAILGGTAVYHPLLEGPAVAPSVDGCFPAAHPLVGYAWLAVGFALYPTARRHSWRAWVLAFALGTLLGAVQIIRGAHFLSHVLWSAWVVWAVNVVLIAASVALAALRPRVSLQRSAQNCTPCAARNRSASSPWSNANVASMPASVHVAAATVTERGAPTTGHPVVGSRMWP
jgi:membrane-associated PAP2 superfamily phosphatase